MTKIDELAVSISDTHKLGKERLIFLNTSDILYGKLLHHTYSAVLGWPGQAKKSIRHGDILFSEIRPANGRWAYIDFEAQDYVVSTKLMVIRARSDRIQPRFLYHFLTSNEITSWLQLLAESRSGTFPQITFDQVSEIAIALPPLGVQAAIAAVFDAVENKIDLNRHMSETLEATARALFKSWFVDFDPVQEKAKGRQLVLTTATARFFPETFAKADIGNIPEGWSVASIADHFDAVKGVSYKGEGLSDEGMPLHNLNSVLEGGGYKYAGVKYYNGDYRDRHVTEPGDVIVANTEQGHDRLLIGYAAIVPKAFGTRGIASHHIYRLRRKTTSPLTNHFICRLLNSPQMHDIVSGYANGTTVNMLPIDGVQKPQIIVPPKELVAVFDDFARVQQDRLEELVAENSILASLRDTLLPKLISGELRIKDAERFVAAAV